MKKLLLSLLLVLSVSCGKNEPLTFIGESIVDGVNGVGKVVEKIGRVPRLTLHKILGSSDETDEELEETNERLAELEQEVADLRDELESELERIETSNNNLYLNVRRQIRRLSRKLRTQKRQLRQLKQALEDFEDGYLTLIDPCGDTPNKFDEVLLELYDGTIISFLKSGQGFLAELEDGNYRTTDTTNCRFSIVNGQVID